MPAPAIAFALRQLAAVVVQGALAIKKKTDAGAEASQFSAFVENLSDTDYLVTWYEPIHGKWRTRPGQVCGASRQAPTSARKRRARR